jgi:hypothetical protein
MARLVAGVMSGAEKVDVGVGVDADDASRDDWVDVALLSSPSHIVEQVEGDAELRFLSSVAGAAASTGIPWMGAALLWIRGAVEVVRTEAGVESSGATAMGTRVDDAVRMEAVVDLVLEMPCEAGTAVEVAVAGSPEAEPLGPRRAAVERAVDRAVAAAAASAAR